MMKASFSLEGRTLFEKLNKSPILNGPSTVDDQSGRSCQIYSACPYRLHVHDRRRCCLELFLQKPVNGLCGCRVSYKPPPINVNNRKIFISRMSPDNSPKPLPQMISQKFPMEMTKKENVKRMAAAVCQRPT